MWHEDMVVLKI